MISALLMMRLVLLQNTFQKGWRSTEIRLSETVHRIHRINDPTSGGFRKDAQQPGNSQSESLRCLAGCLVVQQNQVSREFTSEQDCFPFPRMQPVQYGIGHR